MFKESAFNQKAFRLKYINVLHRKCRKVHWPVHFLVAKRPRNVFLYAVLCLSCGNFIWGSYLWSSLTRIRFGDSETAWPTLQKLGQQQRNKVEGQWISTLPWIGIKCIGALNVFAWLVKEMKANHTSSLSLCSLHRPLNENYNVQPLDLASSWFFLEICHPTNFSLGTQMPGWRFFSGE